ncbi:MAG: ATP-binding protein [Actinomycetota bacterium]|nr:ATP-binding protein [Actinomycetota bacterium]
MTDVPLPTLVVVSGPPGSGKTTLAHAIAQALPCPAVCRDEIKEGMAHAQGADFQGGHGDPLTQRTVTVFFDVLRVLVAASVTVVAEAAFQDRLWRRGLEPLAELAQVRIIQCHVDAAVSFERAARRAADHEHRRRAHGDSTLGKGLDDWAQAFASFDRISIPAPSIDVDTTDGYAPDFREIVALINRG